MGDRKPQTQPSNNGNQSAPFDAGKVAGRQGYLLTATILIIVVAVGVYLLSVL